MISIPSLFGKDQKFFDLLDASAEEMLASTRLLDACLQKRKSGGSAESLGDFVQRRRKGKQITNRITEELCKTFVTPLEREDIEELSLALYRIPKTVEKLVERLSIYPGMIPWESLIRQAELLGKAAEAVVFMVKQLRGGADLAQIGEANSRLQFAEGEADKQLLGVIRELYHGSYDAKETMVLQDIFEMMEKSIDRCRDAGNVAFQIVLKYA